MNSAPSTDRLLELDVKLAEDPISDSRITKFMVITPSLAELWLRSCNHDNRHIRANLVDRLRRDMVAGRFIDNGETIKFSKAGRLLDGQHRLLACVASGKPFNSLVVKGLPAESFLTIDTGLQKSFSDLIGPSGERSAVLLAATLRLAVVWDNDKLAISGSTFCPTAEEMHALLGCYPQIRESVMFATNRRINGLPGSMAALLHFAAVLNSEQTRVESFLERVRSGENISKSNPEFLFRKWLLDNTQVRARTVRPGYVLGMLIKSWNYARSEKTVVTVRIIAGEGFPILIHPKRKA